MNSDMAELASALRERLKIIGDEESRRDSAFHFERLRLVSERIETLTNRLAPSMPQQLAHFMERRSYDKALSFLETAL